jgi:hypothetical protein
VFAPSVTSFGSDIQVPKPRAGMSLPLLSGFTLCITCMFAVQSDDFGYKKHPLYTNWLPQSSPTVARVHRKIAKVGVKFVLSLTAN